jgi:CRISPR-associated protein (Cas_Csm6)
MTILIANIGTSDLAVKIGEYYIPIGFDRNEKNVDFSRLNKEEKDIWRDKNKLLGTSLCPELSLPVVKKEGKEEYAFSLRKLTSKLLDEYNQNPEIWHERIRPGRIWGVIKRARENFKVKTVYIFVTNQVVNEKPGGWYEQDSIFLFKILEKWFERELSSITLIAKIIPLDIPANDQDKLLNYYYNFFNSGDLSDSETTLISIKGGTPQMQTALQIQSMSSKIRKQLFLEPILKIEDVLAGKPSACKPTSYWQYMRSQKYQTVIQLLDRWDFDGAREILQCWQEDLVWIANQSISVNEESISLILNALDLTCSYLNLDSKNAKDLLQKSKVLEKNETFPRKSLANYDLLLDLCTQCKIKWELGQIPDFLWRMSCFYEETLNQLIKKWDKKLATTEQKSNGYFLKIDKMPPELKQIFEHLEPKCIDLQECKLDSRSRRQNLIEALVRYDKTQLVKLPEDKWSMLSQLMNRLDYWANQRNQIIHNAKGVSKEEMLQRLELDRKNPGNLNFYEKENLRNACSPDEILSNMKKIYEISAEILHLQAFRTFDEDGGYYIYSQIRTWVIAQLMESSKVLTPASDPE